MKESYVLWAQIIKETELSEVKKNILEEVIFELRSKEE